MEKKHFTKRDKRTDENNNLLDSFNTIFPNKMFIVCYCIRQDEDDQKVAIMRKAFQMFDTAKTGFIETLKISTILNTMGQLFDDNELQALIEENDPDGKQWS